MQAEDMSGQKRGLLTVLERAEKPPEMKAYERDSWWLCNCECGRQVRKSRTYLRSSVRPHCGCLTEENRRRARLMGEAARANQLKEAKNIKAPQNVFGAKIYEVICPVCQKGFDVLSADWVYKIGDKKVCSWKCQRKWETEQNQKRPYRRFAWER